MERSNSANLVIQSNVLVPGASYMFQVTVTDPKRTPGVLGGVSIASITVQVKSPPIGGSCSVSPAVGILLTTSFSVSCNGWMDPDASAAGVTSSLTYSFFYQDSRGVSKALTSSGSSAFASSVFFLSWKLYNLCFHLRFIGYYQYTAYCTTDSSSITTTCYSEERISKFFVAQTLQSVSNVILNARTASAASVFVVNTTADAASSAANPSVDMISSQAVSASLQSCAALASSIGSFQLLLTNATLSSSTAADTAALAVGSDALASARSGLLATLAQVVNASDGIPAASAQLLVDTIQSSTLGVVALPSTDLNTLLLVTIATVATVQAAKDEQAGVPASTTADNASSASTASTSSSSATADAAPPASTDQAAAAAKSTLAQSPTIIDSIASIVSNFMSLGNCEIMAKSNVLLQALLTAQLTGTLPGEDIDILTQLQFTTVATRQTGTSQASLGSGFGLSLTLPTVAFGSVATLSASATDVDTVNSNQIVSSATDIRVVTFGSVLTGCRLNDTVMSPALVEATPAKPLAIGSPVVTIDLTGTTGSVKSVANLSTPITFSIPINPSSVAGVSKTASLQVSWFDENYSILRYLWLYWCISTCPHLQLHAVVLT